MTITYEEARTLRDELRPDYSDRHRAFQKLRDFWHGRYWQDVDSQTHGISSIFRDVAKAQSDVGPDIKLVRNLIFEVCVKYQSYLSSLPMIRTFTERPDSRTARAQADLKERILYALWSDVNMNQQLNRVGWFGPLMGDSFLGMWPDFTNKTVKAVVRSPEHAYPIESFDGNGLDALMFSWETTEGKAKRAFPQWSGKAKDEHDAKVEILEWSDDNQFMRWVDGQLVNGVKHDLAFNLFDQVPFIYVPGEPWNHGAVEQSVNLVEAGNALYSLMMQAMLENVFPKLILEDPMKFGETLDFGPGSVNAVNPGGKAYYLQPPEGSLGAGQALLQETERAVKQDTSMPDVSFGQFDASIITGKAVNALQGAGTGSLVEMVQGNGIGSCLVRWNEKALTFVQRAYKDDKINLQGVRPASIVDLNPRQFSVSFKGKEIIGSPKNEVVFSPYIGMHDKLVMALQAQGAGLVSKAHSRQQIGISDSEAMQEEIVTEVIDDAVVGAIVQSLQADPSEMNADKASGQAVAYLEGSSAPGGPLGPPSPPAGPPGSDQMGGGPPVGNLPGGGQVLTPALPEPPGSPPPSPLAAPASAGAAATAPPSAAPSGGVTLQAAQQALSGVQLQGKAWLVGQIVAQGAATPVEVAITDPADRQPLADAAGFPVTFHVVPGTPAEAHVEIGGGEGG